MHFYILYVKSKYIGWGENGYDAWQKKDRKKENKKFFLNTYHSIKNIITIELRGYPIIIQ